MLRQDNPLQQHEADQDVARLAMDLAQIEKKYTSDLFAPNIAAAFALYLAKEAKEIDVPDLPRFLNNTLGANPLCDFVMRLIGNHWGDFRRLIAKFTSGMLREYLLTHQPSYADASLETAETICDLALAILQPSDGDTVCDICCGAGVFMTQMANMGSKASFTGFDLSELAVNVSIIRAQVLGIDTAISQRNMLDTNTEEDDHYNKIFLDPPYGVRLGHLAGRFNLQPDLLLPAFPELKSTNSSELVWAARALDLLQEGGRAVMVISKGALFNHTDTQIRQYLVDRGFIESVIALPERIQNYTPISLCMLVLNKNGCGSSIKMINATQLFDRGARVNEMGKQHIASVVEALEQGSTNRVDVPIRDFEGKNYQLAVETHFMPEIKVRGGKKLGGLCKSISRGLTLSREDFDDMPTGDDDSGLDYLNTSNIQDGLINYPLPTVKSFEPRFNRYKIERGDLVLTKFLSPCKMAVVDDTHGRSIICNANIFVIRPDNKVLDPYFLMAFLCSKTGMRQLEQLATGTSVTALSHMALKEMIVPVPPIDVQNKFAQDYCRLLATIKQQRQALNQSLADVNEAYDRYEAEEKLK